jgi:hypothetical protein
MGACAHGAELNPINHGSCGSVRSCVCRIMGEGARKPRSIRCIDPKKGLHEIKGDIQKKFMAAQSKQLVGVLDDATFAAAPDRRRPYLIDRTRVVDPKEGRERIWSAAFTRSGPRRTALRQRGAGRGSWRSKSTSRLNAMRRAGVRLLARCRNGRAAHRHRIEAT